MGKLLKMLRRTWLSDARPKTNHQANHAQMATAQCHECPRPTEFSMRSPASAPRIADDRTVVGQQGHSLLQNSMPDEEERDCAPNKHKTITWTPNAFLNFLGHDRGFSITEGFNREKVQQYWVTYNCQHLGLPIPHLCKFQHHACPCKRFAIDAFGDHLHTCSQHAGATTGTGAHEHILTALQKIFTKAGFKTDRKQVPNSRGLKKADLLIKNFLLEGIHDVIIDVTLRHEFHGSSAHPERNGELTHDDVNGALDAAVKEKLNH